LFIIIVYIYYNIFNKYLIELTAIFIFTRGVVKSGDVKPKKIVIPQVIIIPFYFWSFLLSIIEN